MVFKTQTLPVNVSSLCCTIATYNTNNFLDVEHKISYFIKSQDEKYFLPVCRKC